MHNKTGGRKGKGVEGGKFPLAQITSMWGRGEGIYPFPRYRPISLSRAYPRMLCDAYAAALDRLFRMVENRIRKKMKRSLRNYEKCCQYCNHIHEIINDPVSRTCHVTDLSVHRIGRSRACNVTKASQPSMQREETCILLTKKTPSTTGKGT